MGSGFRSKAISHSLTIVLMAVFFLGSTVKAVDVEGFGGFAVAAANSRQDKVPAQKRQGSGGLFNPVNSLISGIDGLTSSPFLPFGSTSQPFVTPSGILTTTIIPFSTSSTPSSTSLATSSILSTATPFSSSTPDVPSTSSELERSSSVPTSSARPVTYTSPLVATVTQQVVTVFTTISGSNTIVQTHTSEQVVASTTGFATSISSPSVVSEDSGNSSSGLSSSSKAIIGGVVGGVGGALLLAGIAFVLWRLYGRRRDGRGDERLVSDYPYTDMRMTRGGGHSRIVSNNTSSPSGQDRVTGSTNVNPAANF